MYRFYSVALVVYFLALLPVVLYRLVRYGRAVGRIRDRFGQLPDPINQDHRRSVWIHAVSVGEVFTARSLFRDLRQAYPTHQLFVSTTTSTGQQVARQLGDDLDGVFYAPLDFTSFVTRALDRIRPDLVIFVDTEVWPNWLRACRRRGVKTAIVNGRVSSRSYRGYRLVRFFMRRVLRDVDCVCAQTESWGSRFIDLGLPADRLTVAGSLKFDAADVSATGADLHVDDRVLRYFAFTQGHPVLIAASTLDGEDEPVLRAFARLQKMAPDAVLIIAPRHPERAGNVMALATRDGFKAVRRSDLEVDSTAGAAVVVLDTVGELPRLFQLATLVFVGGSLVPAGGHNLLEPAIFGKPIVFGRHMSNFAEIAALFLENTAAVQVTSSHALEQTLVRLLADPVKQASLGAAARALVEANRGTVARHLTVLREVLPPDRFGSMSDVRNLRAVT